MDGLMVTINSLIISLDGKLIGVMWGWKMEGGFNTLPQLTHKTPISFIVTGNRVPGKLSPFN